MNVINVFFILVAVLFNLALIRHFLLNKEIGYAMLAWVSIALILDNQLNLQLFATIEEWIK